MSPLATVRTSLLLTTLVTLACRSSEPTLTDPARHPDPVTPRMATEWEDGPGQGVFSNRLVLMDPARFQLLSDRTERDGASYRFRILGDSAVTIVAGQFIYGKVDGESYLRRVTRVDRGSGTLTLTTMEGFWHEVVRGGTYTTHSALPSLAGPSDAGGLASLQVGIPETDETFNDIDLCEVIGQQLEEHLGGLPFCHKERVLVEKGVVEINGRLDSLYLDSASVNLTGTIDASYTVAPGGELIPGTGLAPVFSPCDAYPNVTGCFAKVGDALRSFLILVGINPNVLPPIRMCIPGTPIIVQAGSLFPFRLPVVRICRITSFGVVPNFTQPAMKSVRIVMKPRIVARSVIDVAGSGSLKLSIPVPGVSAVKCFDHGNGFFCLKAGLLIVLKFGVINAGGKVILSTDETEQITLKWDDVNGWDNDFATLSQSRQGSFLPVNSPDTLTLRLGPAVELSANLCFGTSASSCQDAADSSASKGGTFFDLQFGVKVKATLGHYVDAVWSRDGTPFDNWKVETDGLNEAEFEVGLSLPKILLQLPDKNLKRSWPFECCRLSIQDIHGTGALDVHTTTTGAAPDPDGYTVTVERADTLPGIGLAGATRLSPANWETPVTAGIGVNQTIHLDPHPYCVTSYSDAFLAIPPSVPGALLPLARRHGYGIPNYAYELGCELLIADYVVTLSGVQDNCTVAQLPANPVRLQQARNAPIARGRSRPVFFSIDCPPYTATPGALEVTTSTTGFTLDPDGFRILLDGNDRGAAPASGQVTVGSLNPGTGRSLALSGVADNCAVTGAHPLTVDVAAGATTAIRFDILCSPIAVPEVAPGRIRITTTSTGSPPDLDGYSISLNGVAAGVVGNNGQLVLAGLSEGQYDVALGGLAPECSPVSEPGVDLFVPGGGTVDVTFSVRCAEVAGDTPTGDLRVVVVTAGSDVDADGYVLAFGSLLGPIGVHDSITATGVGLGSIAILLDGVAAHCEVSGPNPRNATVTAGALTRVVIEVGCVPRARLDLRTATTGVDRDPDGFRVVIDGVDVGPIGLDASMEVPVAPGAHVVGLGDLTPNCAVMGSAPALLELAAGSVHRVDFTVDCVALSSLAGVEVRVVTGGNDQLQGPLTVVGDGVARGTVNGKGTFLVRDLRPGEHLFELDGLSANCKIAGKYPNLIIVKPGVTAHTTFTVVCKAG